MKKETHKAGFVGILGRPNAGKSTLLNDLMGEKMSIVTSKAQTTRHRIFGIYNTEEVQIIFSDTPGILDPKYSLQEKMMDQLKEIFKDSDAYLYIADIHDRPELTDWISEKLKNTDKPMLLLLNKIDTSSPEMVDEKVEQWHTVLPNAEILPISALHQYNTEYIIPKLESYLPLHPPYFEKDAFTDKSARFFVNEIIREKILENYQKEIPYAVEVVTERFKEEESSIEIEANIYTERESQKGILLGHKGSRLAKVRNQSKKDIEKFFGKNIDLSLYIKVSKDWRKNDSEMKKFGY